MNCLECQDLLQKRLDGGLIAVTEAFDQHLSDCTECREQHAAALLLLGGVKRMPRLKPPANFTKSIVTQVLHDRRQRQGKMRRRIVVTMALAASVLLMLLAGYYWLPRSTQQELPHKQDIAVNNPEIPKAKDPIPPKEIDRPEPRPSLAALQDRLANTTREHAKVVLAAAQVDGMDKLPMVEGLPGDPNVQEVSDGVRSVTQNARRAFDFFVRELPMPEVGEEKN